MANRCHGTSTSDNVPRRGAVASQAEPGGATEAGHLPAKNYGDWPWQRSAVKRCEAVGSSSNSRVPGLEALGPPWKLQHNGLWRC